MVVNVQKSSVTLSVAGKSGRATWADVLVSWADADYRWATDGFIPANESKSSVVITMVTKS